MGRGGLSRLLGAAWPFRARKQGSGARSPERGAAPAGSGDAAAPGLLRQASIAAGVRPADSDFPEELEEQFALVWRELLPWQRTGAAMVVCMAYHAGRRDGANCWLAHVRAGLAIEAARAKP